ncbi:MAG: prephenate dehydratase [Myxococcales bacterium]|nr:prephenate dehydratase [Myxococcales bacterium]MDH5567125.1 prephenate dehydratase [Myxococcales bacterium]
MVQPEKTSPARTSADVESELVRLREQIDAVDRALLEQLNQRAQLVRAVGDLKRTSGAPVYEASRELRIVEALVRANRGPFPDAGLAPVFREIISATRSLEEPVRVAYLGPEGTFSHEAALQKFGELACLSGVATIPEVFSAVENGKAELGIVPVENTTEGVVTQTLDALAEFEVTICAEEVLRISHDLLSKSGRIEDVRRVASHPQPLAQCRRWLAAHLPDAERVETASTAIAAHLAAGDASVAAIGSGVAGRVYGLRSIETAIEDRRDNSTRFLVIGTEQSPPSGSDLTSVVFTIRKDEAGGLHRLIEPMASRGVNLTSIQLRPIQGKPWEYLFFLDLEGHRSEARVAEALAAASAVANSTRILGSFPRADVAPSAGGR